MEATLLRAEMLVVTAEDSGTDEIAMEAHIVTLAVMHSQAFSDFFVFRVACMGPASATVCAGNA